MKKIILAVLLALAVVACKKEAKENKTKQEHAEPTDRGYIVKVGDVAPDFSVKLLDGSTFRLSEQKGKIVMLQFTASWCGVCRKEMPFIEKEIYLPNKDKDFVLVALDRDEPAEKMQELIKATGITYSLAFDPNADVFGLYAHKEAGVTRNVIINREGKIVYLTRLFDREEFDGMKGAIEKELEK